MRIAVLMAAAGSRLGGMETAAREFGAGLARRGHEVTLVTGRGPGALLLPEIRAGRVPYRVQTVPMLGQPAWPVRLLARRRGIDPSVVEGRLFWAVARRHRAARRALDQSAVVVAFFEPEAVAASRELARPVVYYYAGPIDPRRLARGRFARLVAISQMVADYHADLARRLPLPPVDSVVLPGIPAASIAAGPGPQVADAPPEVLFTGRLDATPQKRAEWLIAWWPQVVAAVPGARLALIGGGSALAALRRQVARAGLDANVSLPGPLPHPQLLHRLRQAGLYVFPSSLETFGIAALEALAAGLPVVASDLPALRESLGDAALLLPVEDESAWVATLIRLLRDPAERLHWAARGPVRARQLTWDRQAEAFEAELQAALAVGVGDTKRINK